MTDIVERLLKIEPFIGPLAKDSRDEITRLRAELLHQQGVMAGWLIEKDAEIARMRAVVRVNGLRWGHTHAEVDALLAMSPAEPPGVEKTG